jgi:hypothetical protein
MNPYPGLRPFHTSESKWFFGRESLDGMVETRVHIAPLTLLFARSGVGKSSFLCCRFIPSLQKQSGTAYLNEWGSAAADQLIREKAQTLVESGKGMEEKPVLVLDQFEDVFKLDSPRAALWDTLSEYVNVRNPPLHVLVSMREEWLGAWGEALDYLPSAQLSSIRLAPLRDHEVLRAISKPSKVEGSREFNPKLAQQILADLKTPNAYGLGERYVEPGLLQVVCSRLWTEAERLGLERVEPDLYDRLGRADEIVREFVWSQLRHAGSETSFYSPFDRVLWGGLTRHLSAAQGVKAIVSPGMLCRRLRTADLGVAGPAVLDYELTARERRYLDKPPESRAEPPAALVTWVTRVLNAGELAGLLKKQRGLRGNENIYELSHDSLGPLLQQFALDLESWIRAKWYMLVAAMVTIFVILPGIGILLAALGLAKAAYYLIVGLLAVGIYVAFFWVVMKLVSYVAEVLFFPLMRLLCKGTVPVKNRREPL